MANINSFSETMEKLTSNVNSAMSTLTAFNESLFTDSDSVSVKDTSTNIPSYSNVINRLERAENTVAQFVKGNGVVETDDNTYRKVKVTTVPKAPSKIVALDNPTSFVIDSNWIFEDFMFPKCQIQLDLKGKIDDYADRVVVDRVVLSADNVSFYTDNILGKNISYSSLINLLNDRGIEYTEDIETLDLPMSYEKFLGIFNIESVEIINGQTWYVIDTLNYSSIDKNGAVISNSYNLSKGNYIRYKDSLYKVTDIVNGPDNIQRIRIEYSVGYDNPVSGGAFEFYNAPYENKYINVSFGYNEIDIIYFRAINEEYNILGIEWSDPIMFITNDLVYENGMTFAEYYQKHVTDFGAYWKDLAITNNVLASDAAEPNVPVLYADDLDVVQINRQLEATLNSEEYNNIVREVESTRSEVNSLNTNISSYKSSLVTETSESNIATLKNLIATNTTSLQNATQRYESAVSELNTLLDKAGAISYSPKYHVRGFFQIPEPVNNQQVIGFDIMYRYLHTNESGMTLDTFEYTTRDASGETQKSKAVFSDWNMTTSLIKEQVWNEDEGVYQWSNELASDGDVININQIDIPIRNGEKVEIKVRSISEAGYPRNPAKSKWSESVIVEFPENLTTNDNVSKVVESSKDDVTAVVLQQTMSAAGVYTHLNDTTDQYKHSADNIYFQQRITDDQANVTVVTSPLSDTLTAILKLVAELNTRLEKVENR